RPCSAIRPPPAPWASAPVAPPPTSAPAWTACGMRFSRTYRPHLLRTGRADEAGHSPLVVSARRSPWPRRPHPAAARLLHLGRRHGTTDRRRRAGRRRRPRRLDRQPGGRRIGQDPRRPRGPPPRPTAGGRRPRPVARLWRPPDRP